MFCNQCGKQLETGWKACPFCGKTLALAAPSPPQPARRRGTDHATILGILWIFWSVMHFGMVSAAGLWWREFSGIHHLPRFWGPWKFGPILGAFGGLGFLLCALGIIAGCGLLGRRAWARPITIALACLALLSFPFGTILGAYTLWALLSADSSLQLVR